MKNWFYRLPRSGRLAAVLLLYVMVLVGQIGLVNFYVKNFSEKVDSKTVVVATRDIKLHSVIGPQDVTTKLVRLNNLVPGALTDLEEVIGKESTTPIAMNEQINLVKIDTVIKKEGEMIVEIPNEWVLSFPKSLRRMDHVMLLPVEQPKMKAPATANAAPTLDLGAPAAALLTDAEMKLKGLTVAYFKDNSANEVRDNTIQENQNDAPRLSSTNIGARLEVAMSPEQFKLMQELAKKEYKFVISYE
ncbi:hypothetical protein J2T17_004375 [Paenibacillus mucilaginosus]|uniref:SAF domain-containing protein n=1 Tax=Paenibacillus mucilaginosus TaxID=61624 RepID=UPI003D1E2DAD